MARSRRRVRKSETAFSLVPWPGPEPVQLLKDYRRIREVQRALGLLAEPLISKKGLEESARIIGLIGAENMILRGNNEKNIFYDHLIHDGDDAGPSPIERLQLEDFAHLGPEAAMVRAAMAKARLNIYELEYAYGGIGFHVKDLFLGRRYLLVDEALSSQHRLAGHLSVMRLIQMGEWCFNSGIQGTTFAELHIKTLEIMIRIIDVGRIHPQKFNPDLFTPEENLGWARALLRSWMRPGSVEIREMEI